MTEYITKEQTYNIIVNNYDEEDMLRELDALPAADVVARDCYDRLLAENDELRKERPVVRCGECKHRTSGNPNCVGRSKDWYCPWGERRQDD